MTDHIDATQEDREALEPCPFCGGDDFEVIRAGVHFVTCAGCGTEGPWHENTSATDKTAHAITTWNTRLASTAAIATERDALAKRVDELTAHIERLGSSEAMTSSFMICKCQTGSELVARIDYARKALGEG